MVVHSADGTASGVFSASGWAPSDSIGFLHVRSILSPIETLNIRTHRKLKEPYLKVQGSCPFCVTVKPYDPHLAAAHGVFTVDAPALGYTPDEQMSLLCSLITVWSTHGAYSTWTPPPQL